MFKKIELWIVLIIFLLMFVGTIFFGAILKYHYNGGALFPKLRSVAVFLAEIPFNIRKISLSFTDKEQLLIQNKSDMPPILTKNSNLPKLTIFNKKSRDALLVLPRYDGDKKRSVVDIIDLNNFETIHTYSHDVTSMNNKIDETNSEINKTKIDDSLIRFEYRHPLILNDGSLISHSDYAPLFKIDICSNLIWLNKEESFHHSIELVDNENIWVPSIMYPYSTTVGNYINEQGFFDDAVTKINTNGEIIFSKSVSELLIENGIKTPNILEVYDPIHLNDIEPAKKDTKFWKKNDLFLSLPRFGAIVLYRPSTNKVIKYINGPFSWQHDVDIISDEQISIFNNNNALTTKNNSEILIYNFKDENFKKIINEELIKNNFKTDTEGLSEILEDGSILVEEQNHGRLMFFDKEGKKEWEFVNKDSSGNIYFISWSRIIEEKEMFTKIKQSIKNKKCIN